MCSSRLSPGFVLPEHAFRRQSELRLSAQSPSSPYRRQPGQELLRLPSAAQAISISPTANRCLVKAWSNVSSMLSVGTFLQYGFLPLTHRASIVCPDDAAAIFAKPTLHGPARKDNSSGRYNRSRSQHRPRISYFR